MKRCCAHLAPVRLSCRSRTVHGTRSNRQASMLFDSYHCSRYNTNTGVLTDTMFRERFRRDPRRTRSLLRRARGRPEPPQGENDVSAEIFGRIDGAPVFEVAIASRAGASAKILTWGAVLRDFVAPTAEGPQRVVLGLNTIEDYLAYSPHFGAVPGRFANRIANGRFTLDGVEYQLDRKPGQQHTLHGGPNGFGHRLWTLVASDASSVSLSLDSADGDAGFPGALTATCVYRMLEPATLRVELSAVSDKPTIVNLTQHSYFNLDGSPDILDHEVDSLRRLLYPYGFRSHSHGRDQRASPERPTISVPRGPSVIRAGLPTTPISSPLASAVPTGSRRSRSCGRRSTASPSRSSAPSRASSSMTRPSSIARSPGLAARDTARTPDFASSRKPSRIRRTGATSPIAFCGRGTNIST